jgi:hypothetical protein
MRKAWVGISLIFVAFPAFAAVEYDFVQRTQSDIEQMRPSTLTGRAIIDGDRSRVDFQTGDLYPPDTYCISLNGSRTLTFVDPALKSYTEINSASVASSIGSSNITLTNLKSDMQKLDDHPKLAGISTEHYRLTISFDMTVQYRSMPLRQSVLTEIDKWTSIEFGDISDTFLAANSIRTGNPQLDAVMDLETTRIKGFPLKQTVKITTRNLQGVVPGSKLGLSEVRTQSRELIVTSIKRTTPEPSAFMVPKSYRRNDTQAIAEKQAQTQVTVLSFEEGKQQEK